MKLYLRTLLMLVAIAAIGCSTGPFLRPDAASGSYSTVNPSCPGAQEVVEFSPENQPWVVFRIYATPPERWNSKGTELRVHFWLKYGKYGKGVSTGMLSAFFPSDEIQKLVNEQSGKDYLVSVSKPMVTVVLPNGIKRDIPMPAFEKPLDPKHELIERWGNGVQISSGSLDSFTVIFPDIFVNGEKIVVPPIHFQKDTDHYSPVLNC
ncbi:MAG: hypothetical protein HYZ46_05405 [Nitrosomonadales bacterium]|nr:hypothetical protein [Nitrosomonadales bacterium]